MAGHVEARNGRYRARFRPPGGRERSKTFDRKRDAREWLARQQGDWARGAWVDPRLGRMPLREYVAQWQRAQLHHRETTAARTDSVLRAHLLPAFGDRPMVAITTTDVRAWVQSLVAQGLAPRTVAGAYMLLAQIMRAAVDDQVIARTPCRRINLPEVVDEPLVIPTPAQLEAIARELPAQYRRVVPVVAGTGLRQGEVLGLTVDRVDWLRRTVTVDRQLQTLPSGRRELVPPKRPSSVRTVPVGQHTLDTLTAQVAAYPPGADGLLFRNRYGSPIARSTFQTAWRAACWRAKVKGFTMHDVRHFYASLLIRHGLSVTAVAARLGHKDATETLRTYAHLWPDDEDRTRQAVDTVLMGDTGEEPGAIAASARPEGS